MKTIEHRIDFNIFHGYQQWMWDANIPWIQAVSIYNSSVGYKEFNEGYEQYKKFIV